MQRPQYALKGLGVTAVILGGASAGAGQFRTGMIGDVGVQPLLQRTRRQTQRLTPRSHFHGFEIQILDGLGA